MEKTPTIDPPSTSAVKPPADINDFNARSDYYRDVWGLDSVPISTIDKNLNTQIQAC